MIEGHCAEDAGLHDAAHALENRLLQELDVSNNGPIAQEYLTEGISHSTYRARKRLRLEACSAEVSRGGRPSKLQKEDLLQLARWTKLCYKCVSPCCTAACFDLELDVQ